MPLFGSFYIAACFTSNVLLRITAFPSLNSLPRIGVPSLVIDTIPSRASQAEHTAIRSRAFGVVSSILYSMASVNFPLS